MIVYVKVERFLGDSEVAITLKGTPPKNSNDPRVRELCSRIADAVDALLRLEDL